MLSVLKRDESGQAPFLEAAVVLLAVFAIALPLYEFGRMANDGVLAASAAEDAAKAVAADPGMTKSEVEELVRAGYAGIAGAASVEVSTSAPKQESYEHKLNVEGGGHVARPSKVTWREVEVRVTVSRDFATAAGAFLGAAAGASGYEVSGTSTAVIDQTISSGAW